MANEKISLLLKENGSGKFSIKESDEEIGFMEVGLGDQNITAYHTEVLPAGEGKGWGKELFKALVEYARENKLHITPLCPFVHAQLKRGKEEYKDVWSGD
ncbi:MAG: N-acetyltransferase [Chitinophagaceae bacterium]|nr:MAG: N-acetyltransferase [Chitinophagaceae bacterium]